MSDPEETADTKGMTDPVPAWAGARPSAATWVDHSGLTVFENTWIRLTAHEATAPTGATADYAVLRPKSVATGVLPIHSDGTVTLVGQARFALMNYSWEMPEGGAPFGEDPFDAVKREMAEEAGLAARSWLEVLRMELSNSVTDERAICWLAWDLEPVPTDPDPTEVLAVVRVPFLRLIEEIGRGAVRDSLTVATAFRAYHMAKEGLLPGWLAHAMLTRV